MEKRILDYIKKNNETYNRHLEDFEIDEIFRTYLELHKVFDEALLIGHIENFQNEKNSRSRTPQEVESAKNWRQARRASVCSERIIPNDFSSVSFPKTRETFKFLNDVLISDIPFGLLTPRQKDKLIDIMECIDVEEGEVLIREGEKGSTMYVVDEGIFDVYIKNVRIKSLERGDIFGEIALFHNINRTATVISRVKSKIWVIEQKMFGGLRASDRNKNKGIVLDGITQMKLYPDLTERELISFVNTLTFDYLKMGSSVVVNSDEVFFFTVAGVIKIDGEEKEVKQKEIIRSGFVCVSVIEGTVMKTRQRKLYY
ncbi:cAMP-dependent protein kinase [Vairimorpha necatrix]|uniref:cAMP-dependent protein kinase n=1 Tax=Vairimorpha necatrix TaxID=6039 RepID=A0AAX4JDF9_9MICR